MTSQTTKQVWLQVQLEYEQGTFNSVKELAEKYGIKPNTLNQRIFNQKWREKAAIIHQQVSNEIKEDLIKTFKTEADQWKSKVSKRMEKDWSLIDKSIDEIGENIGPDDIVGYLRGRKLVDDMKRRSLGLSDPSQGLDITSKGQSIGESIVGAVAKLRNSGTAKLDDADFEKIMEAEIVEDVTNSQSLS